MRSYFCLEAKKRKEKKRKENKQQQSTTPRISSGINSDDKSNPTLLFSTKTQTPGTSFTLVTPPENSSSGKRASLYTQESCDCSIEVLKRAEEVIDAADLVSGKHHFHPFPCGFPINGFPNWLACDPCREVILQKQDIWLSGNIPHCFNNFTALVQSNSSGATINFSYMAHDGYFTDGGDYVDNALVQWKGQLFEYRNTLGLLKIIDLSSNELTGRIPDQIASLAGLISLNLSRNYLTGKIIPEIGWMKMLESLDLSANKLSGEIPTSLALLNYLSLLNLSNNNLAGKIPTSTQLQSFNASVFLGNPKLCGLPLQNKCPGEETNVNIAPGKDKRIFKKRMGSLPSGFMLAWDLVSSLDFGQFLALCF